MASHIDIVEVEAHINDAEFAEQAAVEFLSLIS
jgi:hypothetical protein